MSSSSTTYGGGSSKGLQQRVGRLVVHRVGALEHEHAVSRLERRARGGGDDRLLDVAPQHLVRAARRDPRQVRVRAVLHARAGGLRVGGVARQQRGGEVARRLALAAPGRAVQQVGVGRPALEGGAEDGGGVGVLGKHPLES